MARIEENIKENGWIYFYFTSCYIAIILKIVIMDDEILVII